MLARRRNLFEWELELGVEHIMVLAQVIKLLYIRMLGIVFYGIWITQVHFRLSQAIKQQQDSISGSVEMKGLQRRRGKFYLLQERKSSFGSCY